MAGGYDVGARDSGEEYRRVIHDFRQQLDELATPTGTQIAQLVREVRERLGQIPAEVSAAVTALGLLTPAQVNALVNAPPNGVAATGPVSATGSLSAGTSLSVGSDAAIGGQMSVSGPFFAPNAYVTNITGTRVGGWWGIDGRGGYASSTRESKTNDRIAELAREKGAAILALNLRYYQYKAEFVKRDGPSPLRDWQGPEYHIATELGLFAEDLHEAGLWEFVVYAPDHKTPIAIHYEMFSLAVLAAAQSLQTRVERLEQHLGLTE